MPLILKKMFPFKLPPRPNKKTLAAYVVSAFFIAFSYWLYKTAQLFWLTFGKITAEQILFHLQFPVWGHTDDGIIQYFLSKIDKSLYLFLILLGVIFFYSFLRFNFSFLKFPRLLKFLDWLTPKHLFLTPFVLFFTLFSINQKYCPIVEIYHAYTGEVQKNYGSFYEEYYFSPKNALIQAPEQKQNLIVILAESYESTYSGKNVPPTAEGNLIYSPFGEIIPHSTQFALENVHFSDTTALGGGKQVAGTGSTMSGTVSYFCGFPLSHLVGLGFTYKYFLANTICLGDVLDEAGYQQVFFSGSNAKFSGTGAFYNTHKIEVRDHEYFKKTGALSKDYKVFWGVEDKKLFDFAKESITQQNPNEPFALYISTITTHSPDGYVDKSCHSAMAKTYENSIRCFDAVLSDFVSWVRQSELSENTTIIILGDHLTMKQNWFPPNTHRRIYNAFINPKWDKAKIAERTQNRNFSHFDLFPTILSALGFTVEGDKLGLGVNLSSAKPTLLEEKGEGWLNQQLGLSSKIYDDFWLFEHKLKEEEQFPR